MIRRVLHAVSLLLVIAATITAQEKRMQIFNAGEAQMLPEIKGIVFAENGKVVIGPIPDKDQRDGEYKNLDLAQGDEILFVNGKKIKSIDDFKKYYSEIKIGDNVKLAVQRDKDRFIVEFKKAEEAKEIQKEEIKEMQKEHPKMHPPKMPSQPKVSQTHPTAPKSV